jgi:hypothetical protein
VTAPDAARHHLRYAGQGDPLADSPGLEATDA